jgi:hypothetical protein
VYVAAECHRSVPVVVEPDIRLPIENEACATLCTSQRVKAAFKPENHLRAAANIFSTEQAELARLQVALAHVEVGVSLLVAGIGERVVDDAVQRNAALRRRAA